jgi:hypothetical protein
VERPRRRLLAPARDAGLSPPGSIANGAIGRHRSADKCAATRPSGWQECTVRSAVRSYVLCAR